MKTNEQVTWDLNELFPSITNPKIDQAIKETRTLADTFERNYREKIIHLEADGLLKCLKEVETFEAKLSDITLYSNLSFSADMTLSLAQSLHDRVNKLEATIAKQLAFYSLELGELVKRKPQIIKDQVLAPYRRVLERVQLHFKHQLSEVEEQLIIEKDQFGVNAWEELQSKWLNTRFFNIKILGEEETLGYGKANGLLVHPDRATRESANKSIYGLLGKDGEVFSSALRSICNDWITVTKRRKYESPMEASLNSNDTKHNIISNLLKTIEEGAGIYRHYLRLKAKLMGLSEMGNHDILAPLPDTPELKFSFKEAQNLVTNAYMRFDTEYANAVKEMFTNGHIDASPRFGKRNGAFCASHYNGKSAFILQSFNGSLTDIYTLSHELGHATHDWYASRNQSILNINIPSVMAETASIFGELLLTDLLLEKTESDAERRAVLCIALDEAGMTAFQVTARVWFEQALYNSIEREEFLDYKTICSHWIEARERIYGNTINWFPEMEAEWTMKPHYFIANFRFYNYPYVYAQMFVNAMYEKYINESKEFVPKLVKALSAGGSVSPLRIGEIMGLNVEAPEFWKGGLKVFEHLIADLEKTI